MTNRQFGEVLRSKIKNYIPLLIEDLTNNPNYTYVIDELFLPQPGIISLLKGSEFHDYFPIVPAKMKIGKWIDYFSEINDFELLHSLVKYEKVDLYKFFTFKEYDTYDEAVQYYPGFYYVFPSDIIKRIDDYFFYELGEDYRNDAVKQSRVKKVGDGVYLKFDYNEKRTEYVSIENYFFPLLKLEINGSEYTFHSRPDLNAFLMFGNSFLLFYGNSILNYSEPGNLLPKIERKQDEPIIYYSETNKKYLISNSKENLELYNAYIVITIKLFAHYFRVFEKWVVDDVIPTIKHQK